MIPPLLLAALLAQPPAAAPAEEMDARALPVFERTKTTRATYALYAWNWAQDNERNVTEGYSAEFHRGSQHRVETPMLNAVADCEARTGEALDLRTGERISGPTVWQFACGINTARPILSVSWLGAEQSRFGTVDRLRIVDEFDERFYVVDRDGILVGAELYSRSGPGCVQNEAVAVERSLPEGDLFSPASLRETFVPVRYRSAPAARVGDLWRQGRSCPSDSA